MTNKQNLYKTNITDLRWIAYDIPGNIGWIVYFIGLILCFLKKPEFMQYWGMTGIVIVSVIPAVLMAVGIIELINERIHKLDRILTRKRLFRGFGALTLGGITGMVITFLGIIYGILVVRDANFGYLISMFAGAVLCAVFSGLLYKGYKKV